LAHGLAHPDQHPGARAAQASEVVREWMVEALLHGDHLGEELGSGADQRAGAASRLQHAEDVEVGDPWREQASDPDRDAGLPAEQAAVEEREADVEAGGPDDRVVIAGAPVGEVDGATIEPGDVSPGPHPAVTQVVQELRVDGRVAVEQAVVRTLEPVALVAAEGGARGQLRELSLAPYREPGPVQLRARAAAQA